jgi:hypothetical protein
MDEFFKRSKAGLVVGINKDGWIYTREGILEMPAGRELDALVAEKVMGWELRQCERHKTEPDGYACGLCWGWDQFPAYSTDIDTAWQVVEKMQEDGDVFIEWWQDGEWFVSWKPLIIRNRDGSRVGAKCDGQTTGKPSAPLAICRAALLATLEKS